MKSNLFLLFFFVCVSVDCSSTDTVSEQESKIFLQPGQSIALICSQGIITVKDGQNLKKVFCQTNGDEVSGQSQCGPPPTVDSADVISIVKDQYEEGNRVEYRCQAKYTISLNRHMTCHRGQWTGEVKCLKPCTVTTAELDKNNIEFKYGEEKKLYVSHLDHITFQCKGWEHQRHPQSPGFRQQCFDGLMTLPRCV
ncbi:complement factor H-related protein 2 isoform X2 [Chanos chanos]|uniref:Complement factor H-related protein 2 isoform X2 n=1 Tax=Chanos chanos TaxID=29144 RepID=A0A6J2W7F5_CHACN|nr:complement factor H-related protein 2-like isoform X2 [Chanos chanos]